MAFQIAIKNAEIGKKVMLLSLEGSLNEIPLRHLQREIAKIQPIKTVNYRFNQDKTHAAIETQVYEEIPEQIKRNIRILKREEIPSLEDILHLIISMKKEFDLIIIDHLHYINTPSENELNMIGQIMRELKLTTDVHNIPIVLMSHLRKRSKKIDKPNIRDLYGSSNIGKEATTVILIHKIDKAYINSLSLPEYVRDDPRYA